MNANFVEKLGRIALTVPHFVLLIFGLIQDPRVPMRFKTVFATVLTYVLSPVDPLPEGFWGKGGYFDDIFLMALALDYMLNRVPHEVIEDNWSGDGQALDIIQDAVGIVAAFMPGRRAMRIKTVLEAAVAGADDTP